MTNIMKQINVMTVNDAASCSSNSDASRDMIAEVLKKRKRKNDTPEQGIEGLYSLRIANHQRPQTAIPAGTGQLKEKRLSGESGEGKRNDAHVTPGDEATERHQRQIGYHKVAINERIEEPLKGFKGIGREIGRESGGEKSTAGAAGVMHFNAMAERVAKKVAPSPVNPHKAAAQESKNELKTAPADRDELLKYRFQKWGGDHYVTIKEAVTGNTLLRPSDEFVSHRLDQALKEKVESAWVLDDESGERKHPQQNPNDGDEDD